MESLMPANLFALFSTDEVRRASLRESHRFNAL